MVRDEGVIRETLSVDAGAPGIARSLISEHLPQHPALDDIRLATSELVTNVVRHAPEVEEVEFCIEHRPGTVRVSVRQRGGPFDRVPHLATDPHGRGLAIVEAVSDRWGVEWNGHLLAWFEIDGHQPGPGAG